MTTEDLFPAGAGDLPLQWPRALEAVIDELGRSGFVNQVHRLLDTIAGIDHCSLFAVHRAGARCLGANSADASTVARRAADRYVTRHWAHDPALRRRPVSADRARCDLQRIVPAQIQDRSYHRDCYADPNICDKIAVTVPSGGAIILLTAYRDTASGMFSDTTLDRLTRSKDLLGQLARKHVELMPALDPPGSAEQTRETVEALLGRIDDGLTPRERSVLARLCTGMSTEAVALDMGVMPSSIATYRKRAYARLGISGLPELFALLLSARKSLLGTPPA